MSQALDDAFARARGQRREIVQRHEKVAGIPSAMFSGSTGHRYSQSYHGSQRRDGQRFRQFKNTVYICCDFIIRRIAAQDVRAGELIGAGDNPERLAAIQNKRYRYTKSGRGILLPTFLEKTGLPTSVRTKARDSDVHELTSHDALDAISHPNDFQTKFEFIAVTVANLLLTGVAYVIKGAVANPESGQKKLEAIAVPSWWISPNHADGPFSSYHFSPPGIAEMVPLKKEQVDKCSLVCPWSLTSVFSPLDACVSPVDIEENILHSQVEMFRRGINPNIGIRVGGMPDKDGKIMPPHALSPEQRLQLVRAVREVWGNTLHHGDPAIFDGLIQGIEQLQLKPEEMGWIESGKVTQDRIFQAFKVNPLCIGSTENGNRAQAYVAAKSTADGAVNPLIDLISCMLTDNWGPLYESPKRLLLWIDPWVPTDEDLAIKKAAKNHRVVDGALKLLGEDKIPPQAAKAVICHFVDDIDEETAEIMVDRNGVPESNHPVAPDSSSPSEMVDANSEDEPDESKRLVLNAVYDALDAFETEVKGDTCAMPLDGATG